MSQEAAEEVGVSDVVPSNDGDVTERLSYEAYQTIATIADAAGLFDHPEVIRALDYFGYDEWRGARGGFLRLPALVLPPPRSDAALSPPDGQNR